MDQFQDGNASVVLDMLEMELFVNVSFNFGFKHYITLYKLLNYICLKINSQKKFETLFCFAYEILSFTSCFSLRRFNFCFKPILFLLNI